MTLRLLPRWAVCVLLLLGAGCTSLREIPRSEYASQPERRHVRVSTRDSLNYEFDYINVEGDSLIGYRRLDIPGPVEEYGTVRMPLDDVAKLSARSLDWYRTGLIGGGVVAALVAKGLSKSDNNPPTPENSGGGGPRLP
jgi:hypothetical protein